MEGSCSAFTETADHTAGVKRGGSGGGGGGLEVEFRAKCGCVVVSHSTFINGVILRNETKTKKKKKEAKSGCNNVERGSIVSLVMSRPNTHFTHPLYRFLTQTLLKKNNQ